MDGILKHIHSTEDIKNLNEKELKQLCKELRRFLLQKVSKTGGHLASNLGIVELTVALEYCFHLPEDKIVWDVGHQAYILEGVKSLASIKSYVMKVTSPAETIEGEFIYGMVTNTVSVGGFKGLINQNVSLSDGLFEVLLIRMPKTPLEFSSIVTGLLMREEETSDLIYKFKASELHIEAQEPVDWVLDGEFGGSKTAVSIRNLPQQIEILCPEPGKERKYAV